MDLQALADELGLEGLAKLDSGGQKVVYQATHADYGDVVLKVIRSDRHMPRIEREIEVVEKIASARVPMIYQWSKNEGDDGGTDFWILEDRIDGTNLRNIIAVRSLDSGEAMRLTEQMLEALAHAEIERTVHRDVKPDNIMLDNNGDFWLLDFGIARHLDWPSLTESAAEWGPGTLGYSPSEQFLNKKREIDARADLFALAVTVVESMTQLHPYREGAASPGEVIQRIMSRSVVPPPSLVPAGFRELIASMGHHRRDCRPGSAAEALLWIRELHCE